MNDVTLRWANLGDIDFILETIVASEKSDTNVFPLCTMFGLNENTVRNCLKQILEENEPGCEFSIQSFVVVEENGIVCAALGGWFEEAENPSGIIKSNLVGYYFPRESFAMLSKTAPIVADTLIIRTPGTYQFEMMTVGPSLRGKGIVKRMTDFHVEHAKVFYPSADRIQGQVFAHNSAALHVHGKNGFVQVRRYTSSHPESEHYLPNRTKILIEKPL